ncbi:MAG: glycosyltransferase family 4 protein [Balneolales bacterium]
MHESKEVNQNLIKLGIISHLYPCKAQPYQGTFIRDMFHLLKSHLDIRIFIPTVQAVPLTRRWVNSRSALLDPDFACRVPYVSLPRRKAHGFASRSICRAFNKVIKRGDFDIIHVNWSYPDAFLIPLFESKNIPTVLTIHGYLWYEVRHRHDIMQYLLPCLEQTRKIFVVGTQLKTDIGRQFPQLASKVHIMHNSIDGQAFPLAGIKANHKESLLWEQDKRHVLTVANIAREKGLDVLLRAIIENEELRQFNFHIIGRVIIHAYYQSLLEIIDRYKLKNVQFHDAVSREELVKYYQASDLFVLPSRYEGFGLSLVEAASTGLPVVSTDCGGPGDIINEGVGLLVDVDSPVELGRAINKVMKKKINPSAIRENVLKRFDQSQIRDHLIRHYHEVIR